MKKISQRNYSEIDDYDGRSLLKKQFEKFLPFCNQNVENFEEISYKIYSISHNFCGIAANARDRGIGGLEGDVKIAISIAMDIEIESNYYLDISRNFKESVSKKLKKAWVENDIAFLVEFFCQIERNVSQAFVDNNTCEGVGSVDFYEIKDEEEIGIAPSEEMLAMADELIMFAQIPTKKKYGENFIKKREKVSSKPAKRENKQIALSLYGDNDE